MDIIRRHIPSLRSSMAIPAILLLCTAALSGCRDARQDGTSSEAVKVRVLEAGKTPVRSAKSYVGTARASKSVVLTAPFPAKVVAIEVSEGQKVRGGQLLARLESENVESTLAAAEATLLQAQDAYDRLSSVKESGSVAQVKVVEVETALAKAESMAAVARKAKSDCEIRAAYDGTVGSIYVAASEDVEAISPLVQIVDTDSLEIVIPVPETEIASMRIGSRAELTVPALDNAVVGAVLVRKGVVASEIAHNYDCVLRPVTPPEGLLPGMACKVRFFSEDSEGEIVIPASAVRTDSEGRFVWSVDEGGTVSKTRVTVGGFASDGVVISSGLSGSERIVTDGASKVSSGMKVEIIG